MEYKKMDASLQNALTSVSGILDQRFLVFVHTIKPIVPDNAEAFALKKMGIKGVNGKRKVFSATLSKEDIDTLSVSTWVKCITLSQLLHKCKV